MKISQKPLRQILKEKGIITEEQVNKALALQRKQSIRFDEAITKLGFADPEEIISGLAEQFGFNVVDPMAISIPPEVINAVPKNIIKKYNIIPIKKQNGLLTIATSDPLDMRTMEDLRFTFNTDVECELATRSNIEKAIKKHYHQEDVVPLEGIFEGFEENAVEVIKPYEHSGPVVVEEEAPIVKLAANIINEASKIKASDIHIEPLSNRIRIRYRIDGVYQEMHSLATHVNEALVSRFKILSNIDITEKRKPQDGRISIEIGGKPIDIRVSTIPTTNGESIVMRLLEKTTSTAKLANMGFSESDYVNFKGVLKKPNGIILITGPTGSGKSTTLYAALNEINSKEKKIISVEDPIEYNLTGINQCEVKEKIGLTFPAVLRSMLRQDPNIIVIGEIRDVETAEIAVSSALTGHLVISTLHTNDAPSAITRLSDMGVKSYMVSSTILAIEAQRLVRTICKKCKTPHKVDKESLLEHGFEINDLENIEFYHGKGCDYCNKTGYQGRTAVFEFMCVTPELKDAIYNKASTNELRKIARSNGMKTLMEDGIRLAKAQITTLAEVMRVSIQ